MKVSLCTLALVAHASEKKVPPRHPLQRLKKLGTFLDNFADEMVEQGKMKQGQADRFGSRMDTWLESMGEAFERDNCGYYSGDGKHGGPDPNPETNKNGKPRNRREADGIHEDDLAEALVEECDAAFAVNYAGYSEEMHGECCGFDEAYCNGAQARSSKKSAYDRLSDVPELKWRQITTGLRKWAQRYINNCHGQRKFKHSSKRANKLHATWKGKLFGN